MSRHRNVRNAVYDDYDDDDYQYGQSVEDDCISPTDAQQWIYDRAKGQQSMSEFRANNRDIEEEDDDDLAAENARVGTIHKRRVSECFQMPDLNDDDRARLLSCMDEIRDIVGETCSDRQMVEAIMKHDYECSKALDEILNSSKTPPAIGAKSGSKLTAGDTMEKARFALPKVQFGVSVGGGGNLNDLVKQRMRQFSLNDPPVDETITNEKEQAGEKENSEPKKASLGTPQQATTLAQFAALSIGASAPVPMKSFTNLSELAKHHLESKGTPPTIPAVASPRFAVPQLFKQPFACASPPVNVTGSDGTTSSSSQSTNQQTIDQSGWILDLKSALIKKKPDATVASGSKGLKKGGSTSVDKIQYGFIDCDISETSKPTIDEFCTIDASSVLEKDLSGHRTLTSSPMGVVLGIGERLLERSEKKLQAAGRNVPIIVATPSAETRPSNDAASTIIITPSPSVAKKTLAFEVTSSPRMQSPSVSGRNTPEITEEARQQHQMQNQSLKSTPKEPSRNAKELFGKERGDRKDHIHMVVIGHVDAGKSTLMGHLLFDTGNVSQRIMHKHEQESKKLGKSSFMYAWVLDETGEERERGITMDVGSTRFETAKKEVRRLEKNQPVALDLEFYIPFFQITLLDAPGHKDFIPNMISGANQADVALLVVDATRGEFETGFEQGGQTREHALLVRSLGVSQLGVVVNKLDTVGWSKERFDEIVNKLKVFLKQAGFRDADVTYVPCSGLTGENLVKDPTDAGLTQWYNGPTLLKVIDSFKTPERAIDKPFRLSVADIFKGTGSGFCLCGRIESGMVCVNDKVLVCPSKEQAVVKNITIDELPQQTAFAGDQVSLTLANIDINNISVGYILSDIYHPVPLATRILARIVVFNIKVPITRGYPVLLHHQSLIEPATIRKLKAQLHKGTGEVIKKNPRCLGNNSCAQVEIEFQRPIGMERYADFKDLGRIMLRVEGVTIAAGLVTEIVK
uniref:Tr-type G domain-containing protein n=1 Tax=Anopheles christyi TaxID=43041 RepID=A0A182JYR2_9DIPT